MISKAKLIKKITEKAGLLPFDSEQFFEIFLLQMKTRMKAGEVFEFKDLGFFSLKNCSVKSDHLVAFDSEVQDKRITMILFSEEPVFKEENKNIHFFSIPEVISDKDDDIGSHLSLSIEKPLITESEFAEEVFSAFKSNSEILRSFASKAEILINTLQKTGVEEIEDFILKGHPEEFVEDDIIEEKSAPQEKVVQQEEQNKRIIRDNIRDSSSSLPWDFGRKFFERKIDYPEQERIDAQIQYQKEKKKQDKELKSLDEEKIVEETVKEDFDEESLTTSKEKDEYQVDTENYLNSDTEEEVDVEKIGNFERVKTFVPIEMKDKEKPVEDETEKVKIEEKELDKVQKDEDDFTPVKSKSETYRLEKRKKKKPFLRKKDSISLSEAKEKYDYHRRKRGILPLIIPLAILIIAIGVVYLYLAENSILSSEPENVVSKVTPPPHVNIIERDFEFAVTFPYSKSEAYNKISGIDPSVFTEGVKLIEKKENPVGS
jgi:nucleoid DNA-binding protein